jgi:hypothetical protein
MVRLSLSTNTGRRASKPRSACHSIVSKRFCWAAAARQRPSTEPRWQARPPGPAPAHRRPPAPAAAGSCRCRCGRTARGSAACCGSVCSFAHHARGRPCSRRRARAPCEADLAEHQRQRARALAAAPAVDQRPPFARHVGHACAPRGGDVARHQHRAALARLERRDLLVLGADEAALFVVQHRPVDGAGQVVLGELAGCARRSRRRSGPRVARRRRWRLTAQCHGSGRRCHGVEQLALDAQLRLRPAAAPGRRPGRCLPRARPAC